MAALIAKALAIAVITVGPGPFPCGQGAERQRDGCAVAPDRVYLPTGYWGHGLDAGAERWFPFDGSEMLHMRNHELGHLIDYNFLTNSDRGMFEALMHMKRPWRDPPNSPHEQFAEAVRLCARSMRWPPSAGGGYRYQPTVFQHRKVCRWLARDG